MRIAKTKIALALGILALTAQAQADQLADIKAAGVVKVATFDANPPFGSVDPKTHQWQPLAWGFMSHDDLDRQMVSVLTHFAPDY